jgi:hypothetical protein
LCYHVRMVKNLSHEKHQREALLAALRASVAAQGALEEVIAQQVMACRDYGVGWNEIAEITNVSKPTAMSRWQKEEAEMHTMTGTTWTLMPGESIRRSDLHRIFGGSAQGGIAPCKNNDEILLFAEGGEEHGYVDGPRQNGTYDYTGEGQFGDQVMLRGNKAIRDHALHGKHLRLFQGARGEVTYLGEFEYVTHRIERAHASRGGGERNVFVFELRRVDG